MPPQPRRLIEPYHFTPAVEEHPILPHHRIADPNLLSLDLYLPDGQQTAAKRPVMIMIHDGGWRNGDTANPPIDGQSVKTPRFLP